MATPFVCRAVGYLVSAVPPANSILYEVDIVTGAKTVINSNLGYNVNAIGYNPLDNFIYGFDVATSDLLQIDALGTVVNFGSITNLPLTGYNIGTIDANGRFFIKASSLPNYYVIDMDSTSINYLQLLDPTAGYILDTPPYGTPVTPTIDIRDWAINTNDGFLYGGATVGNVIDQVDPTTGISTIISAPGLPAASAYGSAYSFVGGYLYLNNNDTGEIFRCKITGTSATVELFSTGLPNFFNDGASCINAIIEIDFGDAPDTGVGNGPNNYTTLLANNGPRHTINPNLMLGTTITGENDAFQNATATGDDIPAGIQDDMIAVMPTLLTSDSTYTVPVIVTNHTGFAANLYGWIDVNQDGIFAGSEVQMAVVPSTTSGTQMVNLVFNLPANVVTTPYTFGRFRLTTDNLQNANAATPTLEDTRSIGPVNDGEVEDWLVPVQRVQLTTTKTADKAYANVGDTITYTITLQNGGSLALNNLVITDNLPMGVTFIPGSLTGATGTPPTLLLNSPVPAGGSAVVTFKVLVSTAIPSTNPLENSAVVDFTYTVYPTHPNAGSGTSYSNSATTQINTAALQMTKSTDKMLAYLGENITYQIAVKNTGNVPANNVVITDPIPVGTVLVPGSMMVSVPYTTLPGGSIALTGSIASGQTVTISFKVLVVTIPNPNPIENVATAIFTYTVNPAQPDEESGTGKTNIATTVVFRNNYGQQVSDLVDSVALEQAALAAIANAEGAKIQRMVAMPGITPEQLVCLNKSVAEMMDSIAMLEAVLKQKLGVVNCQIDGETC